MCMRVLKRGHPTRAGRTNERTNERSYSSRTSSIRVNHSSGQSLTHWRSIQYSNQSTSSYLCTQYITARPVRPEATGPTPCTATTPRHDRVGWTIDAISISRNTTKASLHRQLQQLTVKPPIPAGRYRRQHTCSDDVRRVVIGTAS
jgi:hypothetical protein